MESKTDTDIEKQVAEYRNELLRIYEKSYEHFERQLSYISAGALGLSFILIEKVFKDIMLTELKGLLVTAWLFLAATLFINLLSHLYTSKKHYRTIDEINNRTYDPKVATNRNKQISLVNYISVVSLFLGILIFIIFTSYNLLNMGNETKPTPQTPDITRGLPSAPPPQAPSTQPIQIPKPGTGAPSSPPPPVKSYDK